MLLATHTDIPELINLYSASVVHASAVGRIDWPNPFPRNVLAKFIDDNELYIIREDGVISAGFRLTSAPNPWVWPAQTPTKAAYIAKLATADFVRGTNYTSRVIIPQIKKYSQHKKLTVIRLDCLADNNRLAAFYGRIGFEKVGESAFYSEKQSKNIVVSKFEMPL